MSQNAAQRARKPRRRGGRNKMQKVFKIAELDGKKSASKEELPSNLRGKIIILNSELSEVAKHLGIKEKGVFSVKSV